MRESRCMSKNLFTEVKNKAEGSAENVLENTNNSFDLVYIDCSYVEMYERIKGTKVSDANRF